MLTSRPLPFFDDELNSGFMKIDGIVRLEGDRLTFEFQKKDTIVEAIKSEVREFDLPLVDLEHVEFKKKLFGGKLILHAKRAVSLEGLPGNELTSRTLKLKRKHRDIAANLASNINLILSEKKLRDLDKDFE